MFTFQRKQNERYTAEYARCSDFCEKLVDDLTPLYLLAFLLTGSHSEAEQCLVATVGDAFSAQCVFKGWERSWSKRRLIINAIRHVFRDPSKSHLKREAGCEVVLQSPAQYAIDTVARLTPPIQRFVFVIAILERYSENECALLLGCTPRNVSEARIHALWQLSGIHPGLLKTAG
jgi:hypothetical protein